MQGSPDRDNKSKSTTIVSGNFDGPEEDMIVDKLSPKEVMRTTLDIQGARSDRPRVDNLTGYFKTKAAKETAAKSR